MKKLNTVFDYSRDIPEPQFSAIFDTNSKNIEFIPLYFKETKNTIKTIRQSLVKIFQLMKDGNIMINDTLSHMVALRKLGYKPSTEYNIFEARQPQDVELKSEEHIKKELVKGLISMPKEPEPWMLIKAKSSAVYAELADRGVIWGPHHEHPIYNTDTLTGRSKTRGFNIQGTTDNDPIYHTEDSRRIFLCFDWVSADMRVAGFLSEDDFINNSFVESDPYTELEKLLDADDITRDDCKLEMLKNMYSVNLDGPLLDVMPGLKEWMAVKKSEYEDGKTLKTILGMGIPRVDLKSSFSGMIQGTIAEAIQSVFIKISERMNSECILTEIHDSLVVCCSDREIAEMIRKIVPIVLEPLDGVNLRFPVKVSVGKKWRHWKKYKVYR